ncbi:hypothetical protein JCM14076_01660 [Methylosoma difficile]
MITSIAAQNKSQSLIMYPSEMLKIDFGIWSRADGTGKGRATRYCNLQLGNARKKEILKSSKNDT